jgi:hypothetical protein
MHKELLAAKMLIDTCWKHINSTLASLAATRDGTWEQSEMLMAKGALASRSMFHAGNP